MALNIFTDKYGSVGPTINASRWLKYIFLSFTQSLFSNYDEFTWTTSRKTTKIIVQDKYASNNENPEKIPQIIFNRGPIQWIRASIDGTLNQEAGANVQEKKTQTELARCSASFSCIANDPTTSEHLADLLGLALYSYRELFKPKGIRFMVSVNIGECTPIDVEVGETTIEEFSTPVFIQFDYQIYYEKNIRTGGEPVELTTTQIENVYPIISGYGSHSDFYYDYLLAPDSPYLIEGATPSEFLELGAVSSATYEYVDPENNYEAFGLLTSDPVPVVRITAPISGIDKFIVYINPDNPPLMEQMGIVISGYPEDNDETTVYTLS